MVSQRNAKSAAGTAEASRGGDKQPLPNNATVDRVLDAAEALFAEHGYKACTFKMISESGDVNQGLLYYYFTTKERLFSEVFLRRAEPLAKRRMAALDEVERRSPGKVPPLEDIIRAFIIPVLEVYEEDEGSRAFLRIHAQLRTDPVEFALDLRRRAFGDSTARFLKLVQAACPHLSPATVGFRFNAMIGAYQIAISQGGRVQDFLRKPKAKFDMRKALEQTIKFSVAGLLAGE